MGWPYEIIADLSDEDKLARRATLDAFGLYAHYSAFVPPALYLIYRFFSWAFGGKSRSSAAYEPIPSVGSRRGPSQLSVAWRKIRWWLSEPVSKSGDRGHRDEWVFGIGWALWLFALSVINTGNDYAHVTKRFGLIAASQLPIQTLLSLKYFNPFARAFNTSHESVNRFHRTLARVIYLFLLLHVVNYFNLLYRAGRLPERLFDSVVLPGELSNISYTLLFATAIPKVRDYSYRLFFITHVLVVFGTSFFLFTHAPSARFYILKALFPFVLDLVARKVTTSTAQARVESVPGTKLIRVSAKLSPRKISQFLEQPGAHAYLSIPWRARPRALSSVIYEFCFNPFTVADVRQDTGEVVLVARQQGGPVTKRLMQLAKEDAGGKVPLCIEGPYGAFGRTYSSLADSGVDRVLLVAGGVGASFVLPIYKALKKSNSSVKVEITWAVRLADDASWASFFDATGVDGTGTSADAFNDPNVHLFVTGKGDGSPVDPEAGTRASRSSSIEMQPLADGGNGLRRGSGQVPYEWGRPDLKQVVDEVFRDEDPVSRIAVLVCGPREMAYGVRRSVALWVDRGRDVVWHNESFGW